MLPIACDLSTQYYNSSQKSKSYFMGIGNLRVPEKSSKEAIILWKFVIAIKAFDALARLLHL